MLDIAFLMCYNSVTLKRGVKLMEDVMETCWIDSVTMCGRGYKCNECPKDKEYQVLKEKIDKEDKE